jgi:hypothetical protein
MQMQNRAIYALTLIVFLTFTCKVTFCEEDNVEKKNKMSLFAVPIFGYTTDTGTLGGFAGMKSYRNSGGKLSNVQAIIEYSAKKQFVAGFKWDHNFKNNDRLLVETKYSKFPTLFFGIGNKTKSDVNENFTPEFFESKISLEKSITSDLKIKTLLYMQNLANVEYNHSGMIVEKDVKWYKGRLDAGPGIGIVWDSRDNTIATNTGTLIQLEYWGMMLQDKGGAYNIINAEFKKFINPIPKFVLGYMAQYKETNGTVPFYLLNDLGGSDRLRGYEQYRFFGKKSVLLQHDIRFPIWGPIGGIAFGAAGQVADKANDVLKGRFHVGYGGGLRWFINREDNLVIRFDYAAGNDTKGFYVTFGEAF